MPAKVFPPCLNHGSRINRSSLTPARRGRAGRSPGRQAGYLGRQRRGDRRVSRRRLHHAGYPGRCPLVASRVLRNRCRPGEPHRHLGCSGPGNLIVRLPWSLLLAAAMWHALVLGGREFCGLTLETAPSWCQSPCRHDHPQVPLWIAKRVFRWRLIRGADVPVQVEQGPWQFTLQHLLLATFLLAVVLVPIRKVLPPGPVVRFPPGLGELFVDLAIASCPICSFRFPAPGGR